MPLRSRDEIKASRRNGWLAAAAGVVLFCIGFAGEADLYHPVVLAIAVLVNAVCGATFGFFCWLVLNLITGLARRGQPHEWDGMSAEQRRQLREHERRRAKAEG